MPIQPEKILQDIAEATAEAKQTIQELHQSRKELIAIHKKEQSRITNLIVAEVSQQVGELSESAYKEMIEKANDILERIEKDWRDKLGLNQ